MNQSKPGATAFFSRSDLDTSMFYMGSVMSFLTNGDEAGGRFALMGYRSKPGHEPRRTFMTGRTSCSSCSTGRSSSIAETR